MRTKVGLHWVLKHWMTVLYSHRAPQKTSSLPNEKQPHMDRSVLEICQWQSHIFGSFMSRDLVLHPKLSSQITPILHKILIYKVFWAFLQKRLNQSEKQHNIYHRSLLFESRLHLELPIENFHLSVMWPAGLFVTLDLRKSCICMFSSLMLIGFSQTMLQLVPLPRLSGTSSDFGRGQRFPNQCQWTCRIVVACKAR